MQAVQRVNSDGVELAVYRWGKPGGIPLLLVHGYPDSHHTWLPLIEQLQDEFQLFAYDVRGFGASDKPAGNAAYRLPQLGRDLRAVVRAVSPDRPVHLIAHDWGSIQSWEAVCEPDSTDFLASYTSISGPCLDHVGHWLRQRLGRASVRAWGEAGGQLLHSWYVLLFHLPWLPELTWRLGLARVWHRLIGRLEGVQPAANPSQLSDAIHGIRLYRANFIRSLFRPRQRHTQVPVQLIIPNRDLFVRPQLFDGLQHWTGPLRVREARAGHWQLLSQPQRLAGWVAEFARQQESHATRPQRETA